LKQKILIGTAANSSLDAFYQRIECFLNPLNEYFFTFLCIDDQFENELIEASSSARTASVPINALKKLEFEIKVEEWSTPSNVNVEVFQPQITKSSLNGLSSVADLFVLDSTIFNGNLAWAELASFVGKVSCPVLILPENTTVNRLIMVHEPGHHSTQIVKDFLKIFNPALSELPLSVLFNFPEDEKQTENEKFFVDYLKMAFPNIGMQLMVEEPINEFFNELNSDVERALILTGTTLGEEILACPKTITDCRAKSSPLFIYKQ
tara:strand:+ start:105691 stop:106482 length:792 start_codon:yes stop_codon:yes gene_type:complete